MSRSNIQNQAQNSTITKSKGPEKESDGDAGELNKQLKEMKRLLIIIAFGVGFGLNANAQHERSPEKMAERTATRMAEQLDLTDAQKQKIYEIQLQQSSERTKRMEDARKEMQARQEAHSKQIAEVLTPEQLKKWEEARKARAEEWKNRRGERGEQRPSHRRGGNNRPHRGTPSQIPN